jgi:hypothetical protein
MSERKSDKLGDSFSTGELDCLSVTVCPVHASLTNAPPPKQWIEMAWAARNAAHAEMSLERRGWFEGVKCLLLERDLPASTVSGRIFHRNF